MDIYKSLPGEKCVGRVQELRIQKHLWIIIYLVIYDIDMVICLLDCAKATQIKAESAFLMINVSPTWSIACSQSWSSHGSWLFVQPCGWPRKIGLSLSNVLSPRRTTSAGHPFKSTSRPWCARKVDCRMPPEYLCDFCQLCVYVRQLYRCLWLISDRSQIWCHVEACEMPSLKLT